MNKYLYEINCPKCGHFDCHYSQTDELEFSPDGKGYYYGYCWCPECKQNFKHYFEFKYEITREWSRF